MTDEFCYRVVDLGHASDGDTYALSLRVAPRLYAAPRVRLKGYDTPETIRRKCPVCFAATSALELVRGRQAATLAAEFLAGPGDLWCRLAGELTLGRELGDVWHEVGDLRTSLGETLLDAGLATRWPTRWHETYDRDRTGR